MMAVLHQGVGRWRCFATAEKIESDGTDLSITDLTLSGGDINIFFLTCGNNFW